MGVHSSEYHENYCKILLTLRVEMLSCFSSSWFDRFLCSATGARRELLEKEFDGFKKLFGKFIDESGPSVVWDNIEKLPADAVIACSRLFEVYVTIKYYYFRYRRTPAWPSPAMRPPSGRCWGSWSWSNSMEGSVHRWVAGTCVIFIKGSFFVY